MKPAWNIGTLESLKDFLKGADKAGIELGLCHIAHQLKEICSTNRIKILLIFN